MTSSSQKPGAGWQAQLALLVGSSGSSTDIADEYRSAPTPLALVFEVRELLPRSTERWNGPTSRAVKPANEPGSGQFRLATRPALRTARGWARGSLTWSNIGHQGGRQNLDPAQQRWFKQLFALQRASVALTVSQDPNWVFLDDFTSPALWAMLKQAEDLGIALVSASSHTPVELYADAALTLDATELADSSLALTPRLRFGEQSVEQVAPVTGVLVSEAGAVGDHGVYRAERAGQRLVQLGPVKRALSPAEIAVLRGETAPQRVIVPAGDVASFLAEELPKVQTAFAVESTDASIALPAPRPRVAVLTAAWSKGHKLLLSWELQGPAERPAPEWGELIPHEILRQEIVPAHWDAADALTLPKPALLKNAEAAEFLHRIVPMLAELPGVEVRHTGNAPTYREVESAPVLTITQVPSEKDDWFDLGVLVTVDGKTVPFSRLFRALASGAKKLLLVDNTYLSLKHPALGPITELITEGQQLDEWQTGLRVSRHQAAWFEPFEDEAEESEAAEEWRALVRDLARQTPIPVAVPGSVNATLRPYQREGFSWLAFLWQHRLGGILADDMGLGKTLQCLTLMAWAKDGGPGPAIPSASAPERRPFLVVAPTSVMGNWAAEAAKFTPGLKVVVRSSTEAVSHRSVAQDTAEFDLIITSYALFRLDFDSYLRTANDASLGFAGLILDEAQTVKNARSLAHECALELPVAWKLAVTGTPMENSLTELHALTQIVAPGLFASSRVFDETFVQAIERPAPGITEGEGAGSAPETQRRLREERVAQLRQRLRPFMLRRTKALVAAELPEKTEQVLEIDLTPEHRQLYDAFLQRERQKLFGLIEDLDRNRFTVFRSLTLLRMLALDATLIDEQYADIPSAKLQALTTRLIQLAGEGRRTLVFSQFTSFLDRARSHLHAAGLRTLTLEGSTRGRDGVIAAFQRGEADVFLISLKAGGVGLNLTEADTVVLLDPWWNPASEAQAIDRSHRIGQQSRVHVMRMIATGTIEEKVLALQQRKRDLFDAVIDDDALFARALSADDIRDLLS